VIALRVDAEPLAIWVADAALAKSLNWASVHYWDADIRHLGRSMNARAIGIGAPLIAAAQ
jgi:hypothetical protein